MKPRVSGTIVGLGAIVLTAAAAAAAVVVLPVEPPAALTTATPTATVGVTERTDADERQVQLALDAGAPRAVVTTRLGTVTASACSTSAPLRSGDVIARIDGEPVIALASGVPLWRDLALGDRGEDVRGLQQELVRLGAGLAVDGLVGKGTLRAARTFLVQRGLERAGLPDGLVPREPLAWVPAPENTVRSCQAVVGAPVPAEGVLVDLPAELRGARIESVPVDPAPGERTLRLGTVIAAVDQRGIVSEAASLASIAALPEYAATVASAEGTATLSATWALREPRVVHVVPPTTLFGVTAGRACIQPQEGPAIDVEVLGSELGQSFIRVPEGRTVERVVTSPDRSRSCR